MLLAELVTVSAEVSSTRSRTAKVAALAELLRRLEEPEIEVAVCWLSGEPTQGRLGAGWRTLRDLRVPSSPVPGLTLTAVDSTLSEVASASGAGSVRRRGELLTGLMAEATADEQHFLVRLITGELRQGALEGVLTEAVAAAGDISSELVRRAVMLSGSLALTARVALDGQAGGADALAGFRLRVGRGIRPMLASPADTLDAALAELGPAVTVEYKLDGARIQVHRDGDGIRVFTRSLRDITARVPELVELVRGLPCRACVLDGESLALTDEGRPRSFQETMSNTSLGLLTPRFFDCLHLDGVDLLDAPLRERLEALARVAGEHRMPGLVEPGADAAAALLDTALAEGHEGVMVKSLEAPYAAGRRGRAWQKVKPAHTLDLVVLAVEWGSGRRSGKLSNIHLGARDPDGGPPIMVGKTFKGMTDELLDWQTEQFARVALDDDGHVVRLPPRFVVEIELDGAQVSSRYPGGVALRFARVLRYRPDKAPEDADAIEAIRALLPAGDRGG